jgi:hypothetical protein
MGFKSSAGLPFLAGGAPLAG